MVGYLSAEYLLGRQLGNALLATRLGKVVEEGLASCGIDLSTLLAQEVEPGLGNGGLGRLAACFVDSLATMDVSCIGFGIRYEYGIFGQTFVDGRQVEVPDSWLALGGPWEFPHPERAVQVDFGGHTEQYTDESGRPRTRWVPGWNVLGVPYHYMVPGYQNGVVNTLRLWSARATNAFDLTIFNAGDYAEAVRAQTFAENITKVLYPEDSTPQGRELRLQQQYFFVACSLKDYLDQTLPRDFDPHRLPEQIIFQLNDTHPVIAIPELMRILLDERGMEWDEAWDITKKCFAYTCHTLLPEALEVWPVDLLGRLLPRHLEIIVRINDEFLTDVRAAYPDDELRVRRMSIVQDTERAVRMAYLATVARRQGQRRRRTTIPTAARQGAAGLLAVLAGEVHQRHQRDHPASVHAAGQPQPVAGDHRRHRGGLGDQPGPAGGVGAVRGGARVPPAVPPGQGGQQDPAARAAQRSETASTCRMATCSTSWSSGCTSTSARCSRCCTSSRCTTRILSGELDPNEVTPRTFIFGAKAAPGYFMAKEIIHLINAVASTLNGDFRVQGRLAVVFPANYNVTLAEQLIPAADLSEQISLAGKEASGTGNMKLTLNGALTVGTEDGANVEIRRLVGDEHFFLFGMSEPEVAELQAKGYVPGSFYESNPRLKRAIDLIASGAFTEGDKAAGPPCGRRPAVQRPVHGARGLPVLPRRAAAGRRPLCRPRRLDPLGHPQRRAVRLLLFRPVDARLRQSHLGNPRGALTQTTWKATG